MSVEDFISVMYTVYGLKDAPWGMNEKGRPGRSAFVVWVGVESDYNSLGV